MRLIRDQKRVVSAWAVGFGGIAEGLFKMAVGNRIGIGGGRVALPATCSPRKSAGSSLRRQCRLPIWKYLPS